MTCHLTRVPRLRNILSCPAIARRAGLPIARLAGSQLRSLLDWDCCAKGVLGPGEAMQREFAEPYHKLYGKRVCTIINKPNCLTSFHTNPGKTEKTNCTIRFHTTLPCTACKSGTELGAAGPSESVSETTSDPLRGVAPSRTSTWENLHWGKARSL